MYLKKATTLLVLFLVSISFNAYAFLPFGLTEHSPAANATNIAANSNILLTFEADLNAATVNSTNIRVRGQQSGTIAGSWSVNGAEATFTPTEDFTAGEVIHVEVSSGVQSSSGVAASAKAFSFTVTPADNENIATNWAASTTSTFGWRSVTYGTPQGTNGRFVAVPYGLSRVMYSDDGINWSDVSTTENNAWQSVTYGNGRFVAVARSGENRVKYSDNGINWTAAPAPVERSWISVTYGNGRFVAVSSGQFHSVMYSEDGIEWTAASAAANASWSSVTYGNGRFVAVAYLGDNRVMYSEDGINWTAASAAQNDRWWSVTYGNGHFVAVANDGENRVMYSENGETWTAAQATEANQWWSVTYGNGHFVAVAIDGDNRVMYSENGETWTAASAAEANSWRSVTYGNGRFVAVASTGDNRAMYTFTPSFAVEEHSPAANATNIAANSTISLTFDGDVDAATVNSKNIQVRGQQSGNIAGNWSVSGATATFTPTEDFTAGEVIHVEVSTGVQSSSGVAATAKAFSFTITPADNATLAQHWASGSGAPESSWNSVTYGTPQGTNGRYVAVASNGDNRVMYSDDGETWTAASAAQANQWTSVTYGNGRFIAVAQNGNSRVMYSEDGINWTSAAAAQANSWRSVTYGNGRFVAVAGFGDNRVMYSDDGIEWTASLPVEANNWGSVTYGNGRFVAVASTGDNRVMYSEDGIEWTAASDVEENSWQSVTYGNGRFVAVASFGIDRVMYSEDGETWTAASAAQNNSWHSVTYGNGRFVAVALNGTFRTMYSDNGETWTVAPAAEANAWRSVTYGNGRFVAVTADGDNRAMYSFRPIIVVEHSPAANATNIAANSTISLTFDADVDAATVNSKNIQVRGQQSGNIAGNWNVSGAEATFTPTEDFTAGEVIHVEVSTGVQSSEGNAAAAKGFSFTVTPADNEILAQHWATGSGVPESEWQSVTFGTPEGTNGRYVAVATVGDNRIMYSDDGETWTAASATDANAWRSVTYGNGRYVAVASLGANRVMYSEDGIEWTAASVVMAGQWISVTYGNGRFVAVTLTPFSLSVATSVDGDTWINALPVEANHWHSVTYGNGRFVAVANSGDNRVMYSDDGINWTAASATEANAWRSVTYGNGRFVAVASSGDNRAMYSEDGINWTAASATQANPWWSVTYGNGRFVAVALDGANRLMYSENGETWTAAPVAEANVWRSVTYGNGQFVAVASSGTNRAMYSFTPFFVVEHSPAANATNIAANSAISLTFDSDVDAATVNSKNIRVRGQQSGNIAGNWNVSGATATFTPSEDYTAGEVIHVEVSQAVQSSEGNAAAAKGFSFTVAPADNASLAQHWASGTEVPESTWLSVTYGIPEGTNGRYVAVATTGDNRVMYSDDGETWTAASAAQANEWSSVTYGNGRFVAVARTGENRVMYSEDGINWTAASAAEVRSWQSVTYGNGRFVAVASFGTNSVMYSEDGINWTAASAAEANSWRSVTYGNGRFVAVASNGDNRVMYSEDGINWTAASAAEASSWSSVTYGNGRYVAVALTGDNRAMYSENGETWTAATATVNNIWESVTYGNGRYVAVARGGTNSVMYSEDGINWTAVAPPQANLWESVTYGNGRFVAVARSGTNRAMYTFTPSFAVEEHSPAANATNIAANSTISLTFDADLNAATVNSTNIRVRGQQSGNIAGNWSVSGAAATFTPSEDFTAGEVIHVEVSTGVQSSGGVAAAAKAFSFTVAPTENENIATNWAAGTGAPESVWLSVTYGTPQGTNGRYVAVAFDGTNRVMYSDDGETWTAASAAQDNAWTSVTYGNGRFVAVAQFGDNRAMYSEDGINWTAAAAAQDNQWRSVTYGNGRFVAVAQFGDNRAMYSEDGINWTAAAAAQDNSWFSVTYGNGRFVAVALNGDNRVMYSEDGINWTAAAAAQNSDWRSVTYGNGRFVAVASFGTNRVMYSEDGINWTAAAAAQANEWRSVTYGNGLFVAMAANGTNRVMYSDDGEIWTVASAAEANDWQSITYGNGRFVAVANSGTNRAMYTFTPSFDLVEHSPAANATNIAANSTISLMFDADIDAATVNSTNIRVRGQQSGNIAGNWSVSGGAATFTPSEDFTAGEVIHVEVSTGVQSSSGVAATAKAFSFTVAPADNETLAQHWAAGTGVPASGWTSVTYGTPQGTNGRYVAVANGGTNRVMYSEDGIEWTATSATEANEWTSVTYGNGRFVAVSSFGTNRVMYSEDGINWTAASATEANQWFSVTYGNGRFVAVATTGTNRVMYSEDGIEWTAGSAAEANIWTSVTYGNGRFVAVAFNGDNRVMYSEDGIEWTAAPAVQNNSWRSVTYGNGRFVALSSTGTNRVMYSEDGIEWTAASATEDNDWRSVIYGNGRFVAVAASGDNRVMFSDDGETWTSASAAEANIWTSVTYGNGRFVAVAFNGTNRAMYTFTSPPFGVVEHSPAANATNIAENSTISLTFDGDVDANTVNSKNIQVRGQQSGNIAGNWSVSGAEATFTPTEDFTAGEVIHVEVSTGVQSSSGVAATAKAFSFTVTPADNATLAQHWTAGAGAPASGWTSVTYGTPQGTNGRYVAVAANGDNRVMYSEDGIEWTAASATEANQWSSVTYGNGRYVAVALTGDNRVMYSEDGISWTAASAAQNNSWVSVTYGNGRFVAVTGSGPNRVMYSEDGIEWTAASAAQNNAWFSVTYGNGRFVAVAFDGENRVMYSENGEIWTATPAAQANSWRSVTYGNGRFIAVAQSGDSRVMYSEDGETWTAASATEANNWLSVTYGNGRFVAVARTGTNRVMYSEDGETWTAASATEANNWLSVTYGNGRFVAVASTGTNRAMYTFTSPPFDVVEHSPAANATNIAANSTISLTFDADVDANTVNSTNIRVRGQQSGNIAGNWSVSGAEATFTPNEDFTSGEVIHVEVSTGVQSSSGIAATAKAFSFTVAPADNETLAQHWAAGTGVPESTWQSVTFGIPEGTNGRYVAVAFDGTNRVMYSEDGIEWTAASATEASQWSSVTYGNGRFVAVANTGTSRVMYSEDGINWTAASATEANPWWSVAYGNGRFVAVAFSGDNRVMYSEDGIVWTAASAAEANAWLSVTYGNGRFVAVAFDGVNRVMYSEDGINWTAASAAQANGWQSVTYGNGRFVAVASNGDNRVMYSEDGINWTTAPAAEANGWRSVTYGNGRFVAVAFNGTNRAMYTVPAVPNQIVLISPEDEATNVGLQPELSWQANNAADSYELEFANNAAWTDSEIFTISEGTSFEITEALEHNQTYYWRVRGVNAGGAGEWSETWSFTTQPPLPAKISGLTPVNGQGGMPLDVAFGWEPVSYVASYQLRYNFDGGDSFELIENISTTNYQFDEPLAYYEQVSWQVRGVNATGAGEWSDLSVFYTEAEAPILSFPGDDATGISIAPRMQWTSAQTNMNQQLQLSRDADFTALDVDSVVTQTQLDLAGLESNQVYYWRVMVSDAFTNSAWSESRSFRTRPAPDSEEAIGDPSIAHDFGGIQDVTRPQQTEYRLLSVPGNQSVDVSEVFAGEFNKDWIAWLDDGSEEDFYKTYEVGNADFQFRPGNGFWVMSLEERNLEMEYQPVSVNEQDNFTLSLRAGWNVISNPFRADIDWNQIQLINNISTPLFGFDGSYNESEVFKPFTAYYFFNDPANPLAALEVPYVSAADRGFDSPAGLALGAMEGETAGFGLQAIITHGDRSFEQQVHLRYAARSRDQQQAMPRAQKGQVGMSLLQGESKRTGWRALTDTYDYRGTSYELEISGKVGEKITWKANMHDLTDEARVLLIHPITLESYLLADAEKAQMLITSPSVIMTMYLGDEAYLQEIQDNLLPNEIALEPNYPNPFNPVTNIRYALPQEQQVRLEVFDVLGRRVQVLQSGMQPAGWHVVQFDGSRLASGVYIYRLQAGSQVHTGKMMLIK